MGMLMGMGAGGEARRPVIEVAVPMILHLRHDEADGGLLFCFL